MTREEMNAKAKEYRQFRESCGVTNPVELDEIEEAYYEGCLCAKNAIIEKAYEWLKENKDHPLIGCEDPCLSGYLTDEFILNFKKEMEEQQ